jgi:hypothetical protein
MSIIETTETAAAKSEVACNAYINTLVVYVRDPSSDNLVAVRNAMRADRAAFLEHVMALKEQRRAAPLDPAFRREDWIPQDGPDL